MRLLGIALLGTLLLLPIGCKDKTENKSPAKTDAAGTDTKTQENNAAGKSPKENAPAKTSKVPGTEVASNSTNSKTGMTPTEERSATPGTPSETVTKTAPDSNTPGETAQPAVENKLPALSYVPSQTVMLYSGRPSALFNKPFVKSFATDLVPMDEVLGRMQKESGIDPRDLERVTLAIWMGEGHAFPGRGFESNKAAKPRAFDGPAIEVPESPEPPALNPEPRFPKVEAPEIEASKEAAPRKIPEPKRPDPGDCDAQPEEEIEAEFQEESVLAGFAMRMDAVIIFQFNKPFDFKHVVGAASREKLEELTHNGISYQADFDTAFYMPNQTTLIVSPRGDMPMALDNKSTAPLVQAAVKKGLDHDVTVLAELKSVRSLLQGPAMQVDEQFPGLADLPMQLETLYAHLDVEDGVKLNLTVETNAETAPKTIKTAFDKGYGLAGQFIAFQLPQELNREFGEDLGGDLIKLANTVYSETKGEIDGKQFHLRLQVPGSATDLLPKLVKRQQEVAKAMIGKNNFKQIGLAVHNYHDTFNEFPFPNGRAIAPQAEKDKLSWRVHLLPYLDEYELYEKFKLDEAWDSDHNKALLAEMPDVYKLSESAKEGHTQFVLPAGKGFFGESAGQRSFRHVTDGPSNTLMGVTVVPEKAVPWTKPGGFELDPKQAAKILGGHDQGFLGLFADGRVEAIDPKIDAETLKALLTIAGSEIVDYSDYQTGRGRR